MNVAKENSEKQPAKGEDTEQADKMYIYVDRFTRTIAVFLKCLLVVCVFVVMANKYLIFSSG